MTFAAALADFRAWAATVTHDATPKTPEPMDESRLNPVNQSDED